MGNIHQNDVMRDVARPGNFNDPDSESTLFVFHLAILFLSRTYYSSPCIAPTGQQEEQRPPEQSYQHAAADAQRRTMMRPAKVGGAGFECSGLTGHTVIMHNIWLNSTTCSNCEVTEL